MQFDNIINAREEFLMDIGDKVKKILLDIAAVPGISGTKSECLTGEKIYEIIKEMPYFKKNPENVKLIPIESDIYKRPFVCAIFYSSKKTDKTLLLSGHYDVVGVEEFGHLKNLAFNPVEYTKRVHELSLDNDAKVDLESGDWLFGRGTADMKYGIALGIELLRHLSEVDDFEGNIMFLAVPGEESNSEGMLGAVPHLVKLQEEQKLKYIGLLLPEPYMLDSPQDKRRHIHAGACGKIMPLFFIAGKATHICNAFSGLNPDLIASEINRLLELNMDFCDRDGDSSALPPMCLKQTDLKDIYSVQTPLYAAAYYNILTLNTSPEVLMKKLEKLCETAFNNAVDIVNKNKQKYDDILGVETPDVSIKPNIMTFSELYSKVKKLYGDEIDKLIDDKVNGWLKNKVEIQTIAINIVKLVYEKYPDNIPSIIIGFAPPYYPDRHAKGKYADMMHDVIDDVIKYSKEKYDDSFKVENYFMGICDLSYTGSSGFGIECASQNLIGLGKTYMFPVEDIKKLDIPGMVLGPYGKDIHKYTERLNMPYAFNVLPDVYMHAIYKYFSLAQE
jgi:arginine utilization protein RocB